MVWWILKSGRRENEKDESKNRGCLPCGCSGRCFVHCLCLRHPDSGRGVTGSFLNAGCPPCLEHPFGTDALGRDLFLRTLKGLSVSMTVGLAASAVSAVIAVLVGIAAHDYDHSDFLCPREGTAGAACGNCGNALVQPRPTDQKRGSAAEIAAVCSCVPQAWKIGRLDPEASFAAASGASALCGTDTYVSARNPA